VSLPYWTIKRRLTSQSRKYYDNRNRISIPTLRCKPVRDPLEREFLLTFWKIHVLHHARDRGVYGHWMLAELRRHGYELSPGTLYPLLRRMEKRGWLRATEPSATKRRRMYRLTSHGREVLARLREPLEELYREVAYSRGKRTKRANRATGCFDTELREMGNGWATSVTRASPRERSPRIARRVGSVRAIKMSSRLVVEPLNIHPYG
jgi:PadR family transcriptional regulator